MKRFVLAALASVGVAGWLAAPASAQLGGYQRPYQSPYRTFNPILNIRGGSGITNYYGIVRPQMQTSQAVQALQQQQQQMLQGLDSGGQPPAVTSDGQLVLPITGHPVGYNDYTRFFPVQGFRTGGGQTPGIGVPPVAGGGVSPIYTGATGILRR